QRQPGQQVGDQGGEGGGDTNPHQHEAVVGPAGGPRAARAGNGQQQHGGGQAAQQREPEQRPAVGLEERHGDHRPGGGAEGHADHVGAGQRIAQKGLEHGAGEAEGDSGQQGDHGGGQ